MPETDERHKAAITTYTMKACCLCDPSINDSGEILRSTRLALADL